ncbi:hypothetical protein E2C01_055006 [Portunus trituberculatus]|uniref:Uncharacterized protein n=1 Tax=Portunus trituberculatus TaxID=210409 RepID=A0A5B7GWG9_PORTR|nr:hypothetical protein [Portunus trituberculatus]
MKPGLGVFVSPS